MFEADEERGVGLRLRLASRNITNVTKGLHPSAVRDKRDYGFVVVVVIYVVAMITDKHSHVEVLIRRRNIRICFRILVMRGKLERLDKPWALITHSRLSTRRSWMNFRLWISLIVILVTIGIIMVLYWIGLIWAVILILLLFLFRLNFIYFSYYFRFNTKFVSRTYLNENFEQFTRTF